MKTNLLKFQTKQTYITVHSFQEPTGSSTDEYVWWQEDKKFPGLWWWWTESLGWGRWIDRKKDNFPSGGWQVKTTAIVHMYKHQQWDALEWTLERLYSHHSLQEPLRKLHTDFTKNGERVYMSKRLTDMALALKKMRHMQFKPIKALFSHYRLKSKLNF